MATYNLNEILKDYTHKKSSDYILKGHSKDFFDNYIFYGKPDFVALIDYASEEPVLYHKNYNLNFDDSHQETLEEISNAVAKNQVEKIIEADISCMNFVNSNRLYSESIMFILRFTCTLIKGDSRTFLRKISFIKGKDALNPDPILLLSIFDVTDLVGLKKNPYIDLKYISKSENKNNDKVFTELATFKKKANNFFRDKIKLTKREKQILKLISKGKTSEQIANKLFISISTVNTHRQNLIKKFNVKNTSALVHMV